MDFSDFGLKTFSNRQDVPFLYKFHSQQYIFHLTKNRYLLCFRSLLILNLNSSVSMALKDILLDRNNVRTLLMLF